MTTLIASSRLYNATPRHAEAWRMLFEEVGRLAGIRLEVLDWAPPASLGELWKRPDMGLVFLCGRPYVQAGSRHRIVGAPLGPEAGEKAVYRTLLLARASSGWTRVEESFGGRLGRMPAHSQSGYNALRYLLAPYAAGRKLYADVVELETPADCLRALLEERADVVPIDSYFYSLLVSTQREWQAKLTIIGRSPLTAMPFLAASPEAEESAVSALRGALAEWSRTSLGLELRRELGMKGFVLPSPSDYAVLAEQEAWALRLGYPCPA